MVSSTRGKETRAAQCLPGGWTSAVRRSPAAVVPALGTARQSLPFATPLTANSSPQDWTMIQQHGSQTCVSSFDSFGAHFRNTSMGAKPASLSAPVMFVGAMRLGQFPEAKLRGAS